MRKQTLWISIVSTIVGVLNLILFVILSNLGYLQATYLSYVFIVGYLVSTWVLFFVEWIFRLKFSILLQISMQAFLFLAIVIGSVWRVYDLRPPIYDKLIHFASGILFVFLAYDLFKNGKKNRCGYFWLFLIVVSISMLCGSVWEIYEFIADGLLKNNAQGAIGKIGRDALSDTMLDLVCDFVGSLIGASVIVGIKLKNDKKQKSLQESFSEQSTKEISIDTKSED